MAYIARTKPVADLRDKIDERDAPAERGYDAWKFSRAERPGKSQSFDVIACPF